MWSRSAPIPASTAASSRCPQPPPPTASLPRSPTGIMRNGWPELRPTTASGGDITKGQCPFKHLQAMRTDESTYPGRFGPWFLPPGSHNTFAMPGSSNGYASQEVVNYCGIAHSVSPQHDSQLRRSGRVTWISIASSATCCPNLHTKLLTRAQLTALPVVAGPAPSGVKLETQQRRPY